MFIIYLGDINNESNTTNFYSRNDSNFYKENSSLINKTLNQNNTNKNLNEYFNNGLFNNDNMEYHKISPNYTVINQNCNNPENNKIVILNTPFIEDNLNKNINENSKIIYKQNNITKYPNNISTNSKQRRVINERYNSVSPSLKKIEINSDFYIFNKNLNKKQINNFPFSTITTDSDENKNTPYKLNLTSNNYDYKKNNRKLINGNKSNINIGDDSEKCDITNISNDFNNGNKIYFTSDNPQNLDIISRVSDFYNIGNKKIKSNNLEKISNSDLNDSINILGNNNFKIEKKLSNKFNTLENLSSIENQSFKFASTLNDVNHNIFNKNKKFRVVKKKPNELNFKRTNSIIIKNNSRSEDVNLSNNSNTINTESHYRSFSNVNPNYKSKALNDLSKILKNKSVEKLTNVKFDNLLLQSTKDGIEIIDKLINNLMRLKTIMIEEEDKNTTEM